MSYLNKSKHNCIVLFNVSISNKVFPISIMTYEIHKIPFKMITLTVDLNVLRLILLHHKNYKVFYHLLIYSKNYVSKQKSHYCIYPITSLCNNRV